MKWSWLVPISILIIMTIAVVTIFGTLVYSMQVEHLAGVIASGIALLLSFIVWILIFSIMWTGKNK